jgi:hypothetical protein
MTPKHIPRFLGPIRRGVFSPRGFASIAPTQHRTTQAKQVAEKTRIPSLSRTGFSLSGFDLVVAQAQTKTG